LNRILALIIKELISLWRDKKTRFILIFPPLWQLFVFSFAATLDVKNVTIGILNRDHGEMGFELVQRIKGSPIFTHVILLEAVESIAPFINEQIGPVALSIDEEFSRKLDAKLSPSLQLILDGRKSNTSQIVAGYITTIVDQFAQEMAHKEKMPTQPIELISRNWFNPNLLYNWFTIPGLLAVLTMVEALLITGLSVARERELGTFDQLLVSPLSPYEILIGKTIPAILVGVLEGLLLILAIVLLFRIPFEGSFLLLLFCMFVFVTAITGVGLFISSLCSTQQQAILGSFIFLTPAILLSGFATPIENMPTWLQYATYINPARYFMYISRGIFLKNLPAETVFFQLWPLCLIALFNLTAAARFFRRRFAL
jgi:ABC-2 type transport system permease protein